MTTTKIIEMAREAGLGEMGRRTGFIFFQPGMDGLERFAALVRADERNSWPAEMEAMEQQVNILTDALAQEREKFFTPEEARIALEDTDFIWHHSVTQDMVEKLEAIRARKSNT